MEPTTEDERNSHPCSADIKFIYSLTPSLPAYPNSDMSSVRTASSGPIKVTTGLRKYAEDRSQSALTDAGKKTVDYPNGNDAGEVVDGDHDQNQHGATAARRSDHGFDTPKM